MPNVSVIIPCYNAEKTIAETIESVLAQTYQDYEIIVVDDGSMDQSKEVIQSFGEKVKYIYQENGGQSAARNTAIRNSIGKYLAFLDSDDLWKPQKLEKQLEIMQEKGVDWCYCDCEYFIDRTGKSIGTYSHLIRSPKKGYVIEALLLGNFIASPTPVVSKAVFEQAGYFDESPEIQSREDWEEWIRIAMVCPIIYLPDVLAKHRIHENSITFMENPDVAFSSHVAVVNKVCSQFPVQLASLRSKALSKFAGRFSKSHFLRGNFQGARKMVQMAFKWNKSFQNGLLFLLYSLPSFLLNWILVLYRLIKGDE